MGRQLLPFLLLQIILLQAEAKGKRAPPVLLVDFGKPEAHTPENRQISRPFRIGQNFPVITLLADLVEVVGAVQHRQKSGRDIQPETRLQTIRDILRIQRSKNRTGLHPVTESLNQIGKGRFLHRPAAEYLCIKGQILFIAAPVGPALLIKRDLHQKLRRFDFLLVEILPQLPERIGIQRRGIRILAGKAASLQTVSQHLVRFPRRFVGALPIFLNQAVQRLQHADTLALSIDKQGGRPLPVHFYGRQNPGFCDVIKTVARRLQNILSLAGLSRKFL